MVSVKSVEKYSFLTDSRKTVADLDDLQEYNWYDYTAYCVCALMNNIYLIGGHNESEQITDLCLKFDVRTNEFTEIERMNAVREIPACSVFQGKILVTGGLSYVDVILNDDDEDIVPVNTAEIYDHIEDSWTFISDMIHPRCSHQSLASSNKVFIIGGGPDTCEVYDSISETFVALKPSSPLSKDVLKDSASAVMVGDQLVVFGQEGFWYMIL